MASALSPRDTVLAVAAGLLAGVPFAIAALDEMADEGPEGPYSNDAFGALLDWSALVLLVPLPLALARWSATPRAAGLAAGAIASTGAALFVYTVGRLDGPVELALGPLSILPPVGFGLLGGTWVLLATRRPMPRWAALACLAALPGIAIGFLLSVSEGSSSVAGLPPMPWAWLALFLAALATTAAAWWRRRADGGRSGQDADAVGL